ncbi:MAG: tRNA (adenosine(37)-N6)-threonylcarbamoyltransferase complex dimerization subunit type 1 TsaB, partial [Ramlibacter sp.]
MNLLAFDTSTEFLSVAVQSAAGGVLGHDAPGGAQASSTLIPAILQLLDRAGLAIGALDAIVFGRGPGSFTGLRTACSVA